MIGRMKGLLPLLCVLLAGCNNSIYVKDYVTDGDTFYLAPQAFVDNDPVLQSWVAYTLMLSACQLDIGGENPARVTDYGCEFSARMLLVDTWERKLEQNPEIRDDYLETLAAIREAGFLDEYTVLYFGDDVWQVPIEVNVDEFISWQREHFAGHRPQKRVIGSWNYASEVGP